MFRVYCSEIDGAVEQVFDLSADPNLESDLNEVSFNGFFMIDTEEQVDYSFKYNTELEQFEPIGGYVEADTTVEPSKVDIVEQKTKELETELYLTQSAVDFLLMSSMNAVSTLSIRKNGGTIMAGYLAMRIIKGRLTYKEVVTRYPEFKEEIDFILKAEGKGDLITH